MRWLTVNYVVMAWLVMSNSYADTRIKRDLNFLRNIKNHIVETIFGTKCNFSFVGSENYRLFKIPGHDNILVKAVPVVQPPDATVEIAAPIRIKPNAAILESYLGTKTPAETLKALEEVKVLLQSGVLSDVEVSNKLKFPFPHPIPYTELKVAQEVRPVYPSVIHSRFGLPPYPLTRNKEVEKILTGSLLTSYGLPFVEPVYVTEVEPFKIIPEAPKLPELPTISEVVLPKNKFTVAYPTALKEFNTLLDVPKIEIPDYRPVQVQKIAQDLNDQSGYLYQQKNADGTVTTYTDADKNIRPVVMKRIKDISEEITSVREPIIFGTPSLSAALIIPKIQNVKGIPQPLNIQTLSKEGDSQGGFHYRQIHNDGSNTTYDNSAAKLQPLLRWNSNQDLKKDHNLENPVTIPPKLSRLITKKLQSNGKYIYEITEEDGSTTTLTDLGAPIPLTRIPKPPKLSTLQKETTDDQVNINEKSGYLYKQVSINGSVTNYTGAQLPSSHSNTDTTNFNLQTLPSFQKEEPVLVGITVGPGGKQIVQVIEESKVVSNIQPINVLDVRKEQGILVPIKPQTPSTSYGLPYIASAPFDVFPTYASELPAVHVTEFRPVHTEIKPVVSKYVYKQIVKSNPNKKLTIIDVQDDFKNKKSQSLSINHEKMTESHKVAVNDEVNVVVSEEKSLTHTPCGSYQYLQGYKNQVNDVESTPKEESLERNPIVVLGANNSSEQNHADSSLLSTPENTTENITVNNDSSEQSETHRGDMP